MRAKEKKIGATLAEVDGSSPAVVLEATSELLPPLCRVEGAAGFASGRVETFVWKRTHLHAAEPKLGNLPQAWLRTAKGRFRELRVLFSARFVCPPRSLNASYFPRFPGTPKGQPR